MMKRRTSGVGCLVLIASLAWPATSATAQDRLKGMPGHARFESMSKEIPGSVKSGAVVVLWKDGGKAFEYRKEGKAYRYDVAARKAMETKSDVTEGPPPRRGSRFPGLARGRQLDSVASPDGTLRAFHRDRNLWVSDANGVIEAAITTDGDEKARIKNGKASWVYGEELDQDTAFWWSPDGRKLAFYRFDESKVADYFLPLDQTRVQDRPNVEPYPKAGTPNPVADLFVHDLKARKTIKVDVRDGRPFEDAAVGHYAYNVRWSPDGKELLFHRTNRRQNVLELAAADPETGKCRVVLREEWPASWVENNPETRPLKDGRRFLWASERNGWKNYYLHDLGGGSPVAVTRNEFDAGKIVRLDEEAGVLDYMARDGDNPLKHQLHRVRLDGTDDRRLTDPAFHHAVDVAPDGATFIDVAQTHDIPPSTRLVAADGRVVVTLAESDLSKFEKLELRRVEMFTFKAADGRSDLHGLLHRPSDFDPSKKYPVLVSVYAGPGTDDSVEVRGRRPETGANELFARPNSLTELGFLYVTLDARSAAGRGKRALDAIYGKLGQVEIDDLATGVKSLGTRPYVDAARIGVYGISYGGYASALCLLRHPEVFRAACASSAVTDFRHYDTIYTERYLMTPQENPTGYDAGSAVALAGNLKGRLMLYYGTADNNVHPSNTMQLVEALQKAGKSFDVQVGPDLGHSPISRDRMMEFFIEALAPGKP